jgi:hypothetical protein
MDLILRPYGTHRVHIRQYFYKYLVPMGPFAPLKHIIVTTPNTWWTLWRGACSVPVRTYR